MPKSLPTDLEVRESAVVVRPVWLYAFNIEGAWAGLTSHDVEVLVTNMPSVLGGGTMTFGPAQIGHSAVEQRAGETGQRISIEIGVNEGAVSDALRAVALFNPPRRIEVVVIRAHADNGVADWPTDCYAVFRGIAQAVTIERATIVVECVSMLALAHGRVPRFWYQKTCQHALYGPFCRANPDRPEVKLLTQIAAVDRVNRSVDILDTQHNGVTMVGGWFQGGTLSVYADSSYAGEPLAVYTVWASAVIGGGGGHRLYLGWWGDGLAVGAYVRLQRGCRRTLADCETIHNNRVNFGGFPYIPDVSPSVQGIR